MTNTSRPARLAGRRADRFSRMLEGEGEQQVGNPDDVRLLELVGALRDAPPAPAPRPDFRADLRERLLAEAEVALVPTDERLVLPARSARSRSRVTVAAAAFVLVGSTAGMAVAARDTVQGDALYGVKRGLERVDATLSLSDAGRGQHYLDQSRTRLSEASSLLESSDDPATEQAVRQTLERFEQSAGRGSDLLFTSYQRDADADDVSTVRAFADTSMQALDEMAAVAPEQLQDQIAQAASSLTDLDQQGRVLCAACGSREPLGLPDTLLAVSSSYALDRLIDDGSVSLESTGTRATPLSAEESRPLGAAGGKPTGSQDVLDGDALGALRSSASSAAARANEATGTGSSSSPAAPGAPLRQAVTRLVKLPGSQSGVPSVIDLDQTVKDLGGTLGAVTDTLDKTTGGLISRLTGTGLQDTLKGTGAKERGE